MNGALQELVTAMIDSGAVSAVSALIGSSTEPLAEAHAGWSDEHRSKSLRRTDRFDLASLTKPWLATLALRLERYLPLAATLGEVRPGTSELWRERSLEALLRHRSGLPAWLPLFRLVRDPERGVARLLETVESAPIPTYSDCGYMLYAEVAAAAMELPAAVLLQRRVCRPLGVSTVDIDPAPARSVYCALGNETEVELAQALGVAVAHRGPASRGEVQDGNARFLGGLTGHAGLFGNARSLWKLGAEWLAPSRVLSREQVDRALGGPGRYRLGWWRRSAARRVTRGLGRDSFGHHGFTGGSLWIDPEAAKVMVMLAHRTSVAIDLDPWRARFHRLALA